MAEPDTDALGNDHHESEKLISIKVEDPNPWLTTSIKKMVDEVSPLSPECCIYRVRKRYRQFNEKAFSPLIVSIGPFHHGREDLQSMEGLKAAYLKAFLARDGILLETCVEMVRGWENRIRDCYAETIEFTSDDFVKMILLDSCFIIEAIWRRLTSRYHEGVTDYLSDPRVVFDVGMDLILLENQLPFFVLEGLFDLAFPKSKGTGDCFINSCILYLTPLLFISEPDLAIQNIKRHQEPLQIKHLLDLLRKCQLPSIPRQSPDEYKEISIWRASELEKAGMVIKQGLNYSSPMDIRYTKGVLEIPKIGLESISERVLRNLIALEARLYYHESYISDFVHFMDNLIDTTEDVDLLIRNGVIQSFASDSHEVATLFNNLRPYLILSTYFYYGIEEKVSAYCKIPRHKWRATLRRDYCSSPWIIASTVAAMILLILTLIQTICSILSLL